MGSAGGFVGCSVVSAGGFVECSVWSLGGFVRYSVVSVQVELLGALWRVHL